MVIMTTVRDEFLENEWYLVRYSGETPEIALHSAIYFLTRAKDGPKLELTGEQLAMLEKAAVARFTEIITRDINHDNIGTSGYRGVARSIVNYQRFLSFCRRRLLDEQQLRQEVGEKLDRFLAREIDDVTGCRSRSSVFNCSPGELADFARQLGVRFTLTAERVHLLFPDYLRDDG